MTIVSLLELCRRDVADAIEQATVIEPVDPHQRRVLDPAEVLLGNLLADQLNRVEAHDRLGQALGVAH